MTRWKTFCSFLLLVLIMCYPSVRTGFYFGYFLGKECGQFIKF